jgi:energy-coupling factor transporter ATP-binding protein EcfA2
MALRGKGPFPILVMIAQQGSGKSTMARLLRNLIDPSSVPLRAPPKEERDLAIAASNSWVISLDNLSWLSAQLSDALCRLATGGGFATRQLYTDDEEVLIEFQRPLILNGITDFATRADLVDRSIFLSLPALSSTRPEEELWAEFEAESPKIFGSILDALCSTLSAYRDVQLLNSPRMADFAKWGTAAESALGLSPGKFMSIYRTNIAGGVDLAIEGSVIGELLLELMTNQDRWEGVPTELLNRLDDIAGPVTKTRAWPKSGQALRGQLRRIMPPLSRRGIQITLPDREQGIRDITIVKQDYAR